MSLSSAQLRRWPRPAARQGRVVRGHSARVPRLRHPPSLFPRAQRTFPRMARGLCVWGGGARACVEVFGVCVCVCVCARVRCFGRRFVCVCGTVAVAGCPACVCDVCARMRCTLRPGGVRIRVSCFLQLSSAPTLHRIRDAALYMSWLGAGCCRVLGCVGVGCVGACVDVCGVSCGAAVCLRLCLVSGG